MKKLIGLTLCIMFVLLTFVSSVYATTYNFESFTVDGGYGSKEKIDNNITKLKGNTDASDGMNVGPFSKASKAKLADGITEETYVELKSEDFKQSELFEVSLALKTMENNEEKYLSEAVVMTQKVNENEFLLTAGWAPNFKVTVNEDGVYTYRWNMYTEEGITYVKFTLLNYDQVVGTTGIVNFDEIKGSATDSESFATLKDVSVKYLWFCNIRVENGVNVYAELPKIDELEPEPQPEPTPAPNPTPADKDETPGTGSVDVSLIASVIAMISVAGIVAVKKYSK